MPRKKKISILILILFLPSTIQGSHIFLVGISNHEDQSTYYNCIGKPLPPFQFNESDFNLGSMPYVYKKMKSRSREEGKARVQSIQCIQNIFLLNGKKKEVLNSIQSFFEIEKELFVLYSQFLDHAIGLDRSKNSSFLKARYDLLVLTQNKTYEIIFQKDNLNYIELEDEFSNLYYSILRTYFDFFLEIGPDSRKNYWKAREVQL